MLCLASSSPRRQRLLREARVRHTVCAPRFDDAALADSGVGPASFTMAMALFKAQQIPASTDQWILAADTMAWDGDALVGKPATEEQARSMLHRWVSAPHDVWTGVALVHSVTGRRFLFADRARVAFAPLGPAMMAEHLSSGAWRGKAGGYNYADAVAAGWPISCDGDPTTVMGLPMARLVPLLHRLGIGQEPQ